MWTYKWKLHWKKKSVLLDCDALTIGQLISEGNFGVFKFSKREPNSLNDFCPKHTIYDRNNMSQKCEGNCGLWVLNEILKKTHPENLKKNRGCRLGVTC